MRKFWRQICAGLSLSSQDLRQLGRRARREGSESLRQMAAEALVSEQLHLRHGSRWLLELLPSPLCLACAVETLREDGASLVRKKFVLTCLRDVLMRHAALVIPLFAQDERACAHFIATLFEILRTVEENSMLDLSIEVLVLLVVELKLKRYLHYLLDECNKELCKVAATRGSLPMFVLLGKLADAAPIFADVWAMEHSNMMEHLATGLMYPNESIKAAVCYLYGKLYSVPSVAERLSVHFTERLGCLLLTTLKNAQTKELQLNCMGIEPVLRSLKEIFHLNNAELHKQGLLLFTEILKRQPVEIKLFTNIALFKDAIKVLLEAVSCPVLEIATEAMKAVAAFLRKDHVSFPPVLYEELEKLVEGILKQCSNLPLPSPNNRIMSRPTGRHQNKALSQQGQFLQSALESFRNACRLAVECQNDPLAQENAFTAPNSEKKDTLKSFSEFLLKMSDSFCIPIVMEEHVYFLFLQKYSERAVRPALMEVFISTLSILFSIVPDVCYTFAIKLVIALSELLQRSLPQLNFRVLESLNVLSETPDSFCLDETLRSHQYSLLLLFYFAFSHEDRFVPEAELFLAIRSFLLSLQDRGDCPPPCVFKAVLYLLAICQDETNTLDVASLSAIRRILDVISDFNQVYIHHPMLLKFFLRYPELMGRFGHCILQLWFSCEDYSQTESEDAATTLCSGFSDSSNNLNSLLCMLKCNPSALLVLLDLICLGTKEVAHKVLLTLKSFLKRNEDIHLCDLLRSQFLQILQKLLAENSSSISKVNQTLPVLLNLLFLVQLRHATERELDSTDFRLLNLVSSMSGKCSPTDFEILQPSLNFLYWSLQQSTLLSQQKVVAMLLSNTLLLELLEKVLRLTWMQTSAEPAFPSSNEAFLCSAWLLTASLLTQQHIYNTEALPPPWKKKIERLILAFASSIVFNSCVYGSWNDVCEVEWEGFFCTNKLVLCPVGIVQFLKAFFRQNLSSSFVKFVVQHADECGRELQLSKEDASLYPLAKWHVLSLVIRLQNLLIQKDLLLSQCVIGCLEALLEYLHSKNQGIGTTFNILIWVHFLALLDSCHIASQPWNKFLLITLLDGHKNSFLCPEILRLVVLFVRYGNSRIISQSEIGSILEEIANLPEISDVTVGAVRSFLIQLQNEKYQVDAAQIESVQSFLENLPSTSKIQQTPPASVYPLAECV
ncbi:hypothetical protein lerEdw1_019659 [Lerista edwardsae]|nr:hypothetical protein lerEdw1_019659 [Lerista edwardsae]